MSNKKRTFAAEIKNTIVMAARKTPEQIRLAQLEEESMNLVLERGGVTKKILLEDAMHRFFNRYYRELLTPAEQRKYACVIG